MRYLLLVAYIAIEIYLIAEFVDEVGFLAFVLEVVVSALFGFGILISQFGNINDSLRSIMTFKLSLGSFLGRSIFRLIGGILLIIPAILSDIFGITFFVISLLFKAESQHFQNDFFSDSKFNDFNDDFKRQDSTKNGDEIIDVEVIEQVKK